jgi:hypothetical protein
MSRSLPGKKDRLIQEKWHNVYQEGHKWPESTCCIECGAVCQGALVRAGTTGNYQ